MQIAYQRKRFLDLILVLSEITGESTHVLTIRYEKVLEPDQVLGIIIAEVRARRHKGDKLRQEIKKLKEKVERLSQLDFPFIGRN